jgi:hypothetical protein
VLHVNGWMRPLHRLDKRGIGESIRFLHLRLPNSERSQTGLPRTTDQPGNPLPTTGYGLWRGGEVYESRTKGSTSSSTERAPAGFDLHPCSGGVCSIPRATGLMSQ